MHKLISAALVLTLCWFIQSCEDSTDADKHIVLSNASGKELATQYCQSCHLLPDASLIDKEHWIKGVLPEMGPRLGIFSFKGETYPSYKGDLYLEDPIYPQAAAMDSASWQKIINYFEETAPDTLQTQPVHEKIAYGLNEFTVAVPDSIPFSPSTGCIKIDTSGGSTRIFRSDLVRRRLYIYNSKLNVTDSLRVPAGITDLVILNHHEIVGCFVGELMPNIGRSGFIRKIFIDPVSGKMKLDSTAMFTRLARPVKLIAEDFNRDDQPDFLVCEFGHMFGALSLFASNKSGGYDKQELMLSPGAITVQLDDYNKDGLMDIWALFAQGDERIVLFTNRGAGKFDQENILRFQPAAGSSSFELADMNNDGLKDIVYTSGDNGDYSQVLKPYHGVYIYLNKGDNKFEQQYFYPVNGSFKAQVRDFDRDGDMDVATIAYFADYKNNPQEGFIFFENEGKMTFRPLSFPQSVTGRWLCMDVGDIDGNGTIDIVLGNMSVGPLIVESTLDFRQGPPFLTLLNRHKPLEKKNK